MILKIDLYKKVKAKSVFLADHPDILISEYKNGAITFDGERKGTIAEAEMENRKQEKNT